LPNNGIVNWFTGFSVPNNGRFSLISNSIAAISFPEILFAITSAATLICEDHISFGSCSTHPGLGNICSKSF
jgi:hypothetical protein